MQNIKAIDPRDLFLIINTETMKGVESHYTAERATHACEVLNDHEITYGRKPKFQIVPNKGWSEP